MPKPRVLLTPHYRRMNEIFDSSTVGRLHGLADVVWGSDEPMPEDEFKAALADVDAVVFGTWHYGTAALHEAGAGLRAVLEVGGGHRHPGLDYEYLFDRGIPVGSCAPAFGPAVAELALTLALAAARKVLESDRGFRAGTERYLHDGNDGAFSLHGRTVGFIGCGGLSRGLQPLLEPFEVNILGYDPWIQAEELEARGVSPVSSLEDVMGEAEVVFVLAVPTPANEGMLSRTLLERLRPSDVLVLVSRAHVVDFDALTALLLDGRFRAGIDVFPTEPLAGDHPIRGAETAVLTAHLAGALPEALQEIGRMVVDDLASIFKGHEPARMQYATPSMRRDLTGKT